VTAGNELEASNRIAEAMRRGSLSLDLHGLNLRSVPQSLLNLVQLEELYLSLNELAELPESLGELSRLRELYLSMNEISNLPEAIGSLGQLQVLDLSNNCLSVLPRSIGGLLRLRSLNLSANRITDLPPAVFALQSLRELNLTDNCLKKLPADARQLSRLNQLFLHGNPQLELLSEALGPRDDDVWRNHAVPLSPKTILDLYFGARKSRPLNEAKMILVGRSGAGKTSIVNRLVRNEFRAVQDKTDGIEITPWILPSAEGSAVRVNAWDFGGQEIMHATHRLFLTKRSLYLLVIDARAGEQDRNIDYWLRLIDSVSRGSPIIVVINRIKDHYFEVNQRGIMNKYGSVRAFVETDCKDGVGIADLQRLVAREVHTLPHVRDPFPVAWFGVKDDLAGSRDDFISYERYRGLCRSRGVSDEMEQDALAEILHDLGVVVNFRDEARLRGTHILNPKWVTNGIYKILNCYAFAERRSGEFGISELSTVLDADTYPPDKYQFVVDLMVRFELCYECFDRPGYYLVPELLTKQEPPESNVCSDDTLRIRYQYEVFPEGLLPRFIVRARALNQGAQLRRWRTGVELRWRDARALVRADVGERRIEIAVAGEHVDRRRLLGLVRADFEELHTSIAKLEASEEVGWCGAWLSHSELQAFNRAGTTAVPKLIKGEIVNVDVSALLNEIKEPLGDRQWPDETTAWNVAVSYSHNDESLRLQLASYLKILERANLLRVWYDRHILAGDRVHQEISNKLQFADMVLLLVSADFIASDYCHDVEMAISLSRHQRGETVVIPVIIRECPWRTGALGALNALPKDGKAVTSWRIREEAWNDVANGIEEVVRGRRRPCSGSGR
jgi:internalin A